MKPHFPYLSEIRLDDWNTDLKSELSNSSRRFLFFGVLSIFSSQYINKYTQILTHHILHILVGVFSYL